MQELIHTVICIEVPLEIALCRRIMRNSTYDYIGEPVDARLKHVLEYVKSFHDGEGLAIRSLQEHLKVTSDLIFDGLQPKERLVDELVAYISGI